MTPASSSSPPLGVADALTREAVESLAARGRRGAASAALARGRRGAPPLRRRRGPLPRPGGVSATTACAAAPTAASAPATETSSATACSAEAILACARKAREFGYGTLVMQSGEDYGIETEWLPRGTPHQAPRRRSPCTLSLGERPDDDLTGWRAAGADRYLLRFETSDEELYRRIHPDLPGRVSDRMAILRRAAGARLRGRDGHHGRHPRPDAREHRRRHRALPRHGHGHDRHRAVPAAPGDTAGAGVRAAARPTATGRRTRRPTASS